MPYADPNKKAEYQRRYAENNAEKLRRYWKKYREKNFEKYRKMGKIRYWKNPELMRKKSSERRMKNRAECPEKIREYFKKYLHQKRSQSPEFRALASLRSRTVALLRGKNKSAKTLELVGCPMAWLEVHLESLFKPGMTWENYGPVWHVDHKRSCASFDLTDPEQQRICFHWTNLQPLWAKENLSKGTKYVV